jgi:hypothetical protein
MADPEMETKRVVLLRVSLGRAFLEIAPHVKETCFEKDPASMQVFWCYLAHMIDVQGLAKQEMITALRERVLYFWRSRESLQKCQCK